MSDSSNNNDSVQPSPPEQSITASGNRNEKMIHNTGHRKFNNRDGKNVSVASEDKDFEGRTKDIGGVLGLKHEKLTHKVSFDTFREILTEYVLKEFQNARHVVPLVEELTNPMKEFVDRNKPKIKRKMSSDETSEAKKVKTEGTTSFSKDDDESNSDEEEMTNYYDPDDFVERMLLETKIKAYVAQEEQLKNNMSKIYVIVWGQCSSCLQAIIKGDNDYDSKHKRRDVIWLFDQIKITTAGIDNKSNKYKNLLASLMTLFTMRQGETESNDKFLTRFKSNVQTVELSGGNDFLIPLKWLDSHHSERDKFEEKQKFLAMLFLSRSDQKRFGHLLVSLQKQMNLGIDQYPVTLALSFDLLIRESGVFEQQQYQQRQQVFKRKPHNKFMFLQLKQGCTVTKNKDDLVAGVNGSYFKGITCYNCQNMGHYSNDCPYVNAKKGVNLHMRAITLTQNDPTVGEINPNWILLDTCSTASVAGNASLVTNIRPCDAGDELHIATNGGGMRYDMQAQLELFPVPVHFNEDSIATILALKDVASLPGCYLTMDTRQARQILVSFEGSTVTYVFKECADGLYFYDTKASVASKLSRNNNNVNPYTFLQTVASNKSFYTTKDIDKADSARELQRRLGFPGTATLKGYLKDNLVSNTSLTTDDIARGDAIYGPLPQLLKGKCTDSHIPYLTPPTASPVSPIFLAQCPNLALFADYFFVNGLCFLLTNTEKIGFLTAKFCTSTGGVELIRGLEHVVDIHARRGFTISTVHGDNDFCTKKLREGLPSLFFHSCAADQHVGEAERPIRTIKERSRCITHDIPYTIFT